MGSSLKNNLALTQCSKPNTEIGQVHLHAIPVEMSLGRCLEVYTMYVLRAYVYVCVLMNIFIYIIYT